MNSLTENVKTIRVENAAAAGQTAVNSDGVDTTGLEGLRFLVLWGAITAGGVQSAKLQQSDDDGSSDAYSDIEGTSISVADDDDNKITILELIRPQKKYVRCVVSRATQDSALDGIVAELFNPRTAPVTADDTVSGQEITVDAGEGTA